MIETVCTISQHKHNEQPLNVLTTQAAAPGAKVSQASKKKSKQKRRNYSLKQNGSKKHSKSSRYEAFTVQLLYCWIVSEMHQKVKQVDVYPSCYIVKELAPLEHKQYGISRRSYSVVFKHSKQIQKHLGLLQTQDHPSLTGLTANQFTVVSQT